MTSRALLAALAALLLVVAACEAPEDADAEQDADEDATAEEPDEVDDEEDDADEAEKDDEEVADDEEVDEGDGRLEQTLDEPVVWEEDDFRIEVGELAISSREWLEDDLDDAGMEAAELDAALDESTETLVAIDVEATHDADRAVDWYPDQGELIAGDEQVDADLFLTGDVGRSDWEPGTSRSDQVVWQLDAPWEEVQGLGEAEYRVRGASDLDDIDFSGPDAEVTLSWDPIE